MCDDVLSGPQDPPRCSSSFRSREMSDIRSCEKIRIPPPGTLLQPSIPSSGYATRDPAGGRRVYGPLDPGGFLLRKRIGGERLRGWRCTQMHPKGTARAESASPVRHRTRRRVGRDRDIVTGRCPATKRTSADLDDSLRGSGPKGIRTPDLLAASQALYQLSYGPGAPESNGRMRPRPALPSPSVARPATVVRGRNTRARSDRRRARRRRCSRGATIPRPPRLPGEPDAPPVAP
jgi:hypothetical protein